MDLALNNQQRLKCHKTQTMIPNYPSSKEFINYKTFDTDKHHKNILKLLQHKVTPHTTKKTPKNLAVSFYIKYKHTWNMLKNIKIDDVFTKVSMKYKI